MINIDLETTLKARIVVNPCNVSLIWLYRGDSATDETRLSSRAEFL